MEEFKIWIENILPEEAWIRALYAGLFTWGLTALGASLVFFFKGSSRKALDVALGFTGGVMIAASFWSLLAPSIDYGEATNKRNKTEAVEAHLNIELKTLDINKSTEAPLDTIVPKTLEKNKPVEPETKDLIFTEKNETEIDEYIKKEQIEYNSFPPWIPSAIGFLLGALFLYWLDKIIPHLHLFAKRE